MNDTDKKMIEDAEKLDAEATPAEWSRMTFGVLKRADSNFIVGARTLLPALARQLREALLLPSKGETTNPVFALGQLRHLYAQMLSGDVKDTAEAARGLLGPSIEACERALEMREQLDVQLAGCLTAAEGWIAPRCEEAKHGDYGWSLPYAKVVELRRRFEEARADVEYLRGQLVETQRKLNATSEALDRQYSRRDYLESIRQ